MKKLFGKGNTVAVGKGRPRGSVTSKVTLQIMTAAALKDRLKDLNKEYDYMTPSQKLRYFEILLPFATPRLAATSVDQWSHRSDQELDQAVNSVVNKLTKAKETIKIKANDKIEEAIPAGKDKIAGSGGGGTDLSRSVDKQAD